ncbi:hypothetical protein [Streptomyces avermitilis]|uniref:hypothetical protein n=1 Tax=Streptomyces avermitilis TaxID=33903 RepID=UPI0038186944
MIFVTDGDMAEAARVLWVVMTDQARTAMSHPAFCGIWAERYGWREHKRRQSSRLICVEHANAEHRQWRPLQRYTQRRETYGDTHRAIAALTALAMARLHRDRCALRPRHISHRAYPSNCAQDKDRFIEARMTRP